MKSLVETVGKHGPLWRQVGKRKNDRPILGELQSLANTYFRKPPVVKWRRMKGRSGEADLEKRVIYLNRYNQKGPGCEIGLGLFYRPRVKFNPPLSSKEEYYLTLLHEIGHFKIRNPMPRSVRKIIRKLRTESLDLKPNLKANRLRERMWEEAGALPMIDGRTDDEYTTRVEIVRHWIFGMDIVGHARVENWAIKEFRRLRNSFKRSPSSF